MGKTVVVRNVLGTLLTDVSANWIDSFTTFAEYEQLPFEFVHWDLVEDGEEVDLFVTNLGSSEFVRRETARLIHEMSEKGIPVLIISSRPWIAEFYNFAGNVTVTGYASEGLPGVFRKMHKLLRVE